MLHEVELRDGLGEMLLHFRQGALAPFMCERQRFDRICTYYTLAHDRNPAPRARLDNLGRAVRERRPINGVGVFMRDGPGRQRFCVSLV